MFSVITISTFSSFGSIQEEEEEGTEEAEAKGTEEEESDTENKPKDVHHPNVVVAQKDRLSELPYGQQIGRRRRTYINNYKLFENNRPMKDQQQQQQHQQKNNNNRKEELQQNTEALANETSQLPPPTTTTTTTKAKIRLPCLTEQYDILASSSLHSSGICSLPSRSISMDKGILSKRKTFRLPSRSTSMERILRI